MRLLIQRVSAACVEVDGKAIAEIESGLLVFIGITHSDTETEVAWLADKLVALRIFSDAEGKTNASLQECGGSLLVVSQFTLYADCNGGRRPAFVKAALPAVAEPLYESFIAHLRKKNIPVRSGIFGAYMQISLTNDGPFTLMLERNAPVQ
jgi:D-tyrosyl-tRNA(Tyr) deacylase